MPLLRRQPFTKQKPPANLRPDEEVFFSPLTNEIFRDYEEFFNRILLCNSLVWSCSVTGRPGLTYQEAVESEARARRQLESMPEYLVRPVLYLAMLTHRSRLNDMDDDVFSYAKDRYFTGERVEVISKGERRMCTVKQVLPPNGQALNAPAADDVIVITDSESETDSKSSESKKEADKIQAFGPDHGRYLYEVQDIHGGSIYMVKGVNVNRKKGLFTREKSKLFLKHYCDSQDNGIWKVKARYVKKFKLSEARLEDFFMGPSPNFEVSEAKRRPGRQSGEGNKEDSLLKKHLKELKEKKKKEKMAAKEQKKEKKYKKKTATTLSEQPSQSSQNSAQSGSTVKEESPESVRAKTHLTQEERAELKAKLKAERLAQKQAKKEETKKKMEEERQKKKEERDRLQEEKKQRDAYLKEWNKPREDMECEDLKHLPRPTPVETLVSPELFGDTVMMLDFLHIYGGLFELDKAIPEGVTFESLCKAILERDTNGQYADLVMFLLTALFELQEEEAEEGSELEKDNVNVKIPEATEDDVNASDKSYKGRIILATIASQLPQQNFGSKLSKLQMDSFTVTEILRLHLLGSGAKMSEHSAKFCYQQRGGYTSADDPGLEFMMQEPDLVQALSRSNVYDLPPRDKLKILSTLMGQLLTFVGCRDFIDDQFDRIRQLRSELRQLQAVEQRREKDEATFWYRKRLEERNKERELEAQRKDQKKKIREERLRVEEMRKDLKEKAKKEGKKLEEYLQENGITIPELPEMPAEENKPNTETEEKKEEPKEGERKSARQKALQEKEITMEDFMQENVEWDRVSPEEKAKMKEFYETKERLLMEAVYAAQSGASNSPLGLDRTYRRYWMFSSLPGLFVEDDDEFISNDILQPVEQEVKDQFKSENLPIRMENGEKGVEDKSTSSDKENESFDGSGAKGGVISGDKPLTSNGSNMSQDAATPDAPVAADNQETPMDMEEKTYIKPENRLVSVTEQIQECGKVRWAYYSSPEVLEELVSNLNPRGNREGQLRNVLIERKKQLSSSITKCPCSILTISQEENKKADQCMVYHQSIKSRNRTTQGAVGNDSAKEFLELNLREMLLDIEERIYIGSLGAIKVKDRMSWKNCIEQGGYEPQDPEMKWRNKESQSSDSSQGTDTMDVDEPEGDRGVSVVKDLARALIQIERGLDRKYLNSPLSTNTDTKKTKKSTQEGGKKKKEDSLSDDEDDEEEMKKTPVERWEDGLLSCSSLPQLFLYLSVLEKSIIWSKSALHARCRICRRKGDADKMLLCDACDRGHHMFCLKPPVKNVPRGDWFCPQCRPKLQKPRTPRKNRKSFCEEPEPESSDSDDESDKEEEEDDSDVDSSDDEEEASTEEDEEDEDTDVGTEDEWEDQPTKIKLKAHPKRKDAKQSEASSGGQKSASSSRNSTPKQTAGGSRSSTPKESGGGSSSRSRTTKQRVSMDTSLELPKSRSGRGSARNSLEPEPRSSSKTDKSSSKKPRPDSRPSSAKRDGQKSDSKANKRKRDSTEPMEGDGSPALKKTATKSRGGEWADQMKLAENLVHELIQHDESWPFLKPVTRKEAPDYFEIIKTPMDLCTIRAKINKFEYNSPVSILEDIQLVFRNCEAYNLQTSEEYKAGQRLVKLFVQRVKDMKLDDLIRKSVQSNGDSSSGRSLRRH